MTRKAGPASIQPSRRSARERSLMVPRGAATGWVFSVGGSVVVLIAAGLLTGRPGSGPGPAHRSRASPTTAGGTRAGWVRRPRCSTPSRSEEHTPELQSRQYLVCRLLLEKEDTHGDDHDEHRKRQLLNSGRA